jgi:hypothetical protein
MDDLIQKKAREYSLYRAENATEDAERDIKQNALKLFYLDFEEVPELMAIAEEPNHLPSFQHIYIGMGCIDPVQSEDCPSVYRSALENALAYGVCYNRTIAARFGLKLKTEPDYLPSETYDFLSLAGKWEHVQMELQDIQPLFGGRDIWVDGLGMALVRSVRPISRGLEETIFRLSLKSSDTERLFHAFISKDFISLRTSDEPAPPDQGRPTIILTNAGGRKHEVSYWDAPMPGSDLVAFERFQAVYKALLRLEMVAKETATAIHTGQYGSDKTWKNLLDKVKEGKANQF